MMMRRKACRALLALGGLAALGCSRAVPAPGGFTKVDDMEGDSSGVIDWTPPTGLRGAWFSATSCTQADRIAPLPSYAPGGGWSYDELPAADSNQTLPGVPSTHAAHLRTTSDLTGVWGANMGFDLAVPAAPDGGRTSPPPSPADAGVPAIGDGCVEVSSRHTSAIPVDLTGYSGLTFWAMSKGGNSKSSSHLAVQLADINVDPRGHMCNPDENDESGCYNHFRKVVGLSPTMTRYTVDFDELKQDPTWGYHPTDKPVLQLVYQLTFEVDEAGCARDPNAKCAGGSPPPLSFDVWVDDIYFVANK